VTTSEADASTTRRRPLAGVLVLIATLVWSGCTGVAVRRAHTFSLRDAWRESTGTAEELSARSLQTLRQWDLDALYRSSPRRAFEALQAIAVRDPQPEPVFALAEIAFRLGRQAERRDPHLACGYYYLTAGYAYHYLFPVQEIEDSRPAPPDGLTPTSVNCFDPRFRIACDLYNAGLARCIRVAQKSDRLDPRASLNLPTPDGLGFQLTVEHHGFSWRPDEFGPLLFCEDYEVTGLANYHRNYGLGVPLMGTLSPAAVRPSAARYPRDLSFPVTAFLRFNGGLGDLGAHRAGKLELYNSLDVQAVEVKGRAVPLEADLTTPLAYFLARTDLDQNELTGFLKAEKARNQSGIYIMEPYQPGKIPVVMVHGLLSSPLIWTSMFNDLRADPALRSRFQFWFFLYPTGNPYLTAAADLRDTLDRLREEFDPDHADAALDHMVFVTHSMGGLVTKLLTVDSDDSFFRLVSRKPLDELKLKPEVRTELARLFYFRGQPEVERVVFLGTPHHGSKLSPSPLGRLAVKFVKLPKDVLETAADIVQENPGDWLAGGPDRIPTSVDLLAPNAPALEVLAAKPKPTGVTFHSIIGQAPKSSLLLDVARWFEGPDELTDGIVPYRSSHLESADSEVIVFADHTHVHQHPLAIQEVRRILYEHLRSLDLPAGR
jgi:pimeloyl-ACP methyl ester carboxylesterase